MYCPETGAFIHGIAAHGLFKFVIVGLGFIGVWVFRAEGAKLHGY